MLNSDMCLLLDIFNETSGGKGPEPGFSLGGVSPAVSPQPVCTYGACAESRTADFVRAYATNNTLFMEDFTAVWIKMVTKGYDVCDLAVVPAEGSGPDFEELYGIDAIKQDCEAAPGAALFDVDGPVTSGVLGGGVAAADGLADGPGASPGLVQVSGAAGGAAAAPEDARGAAGPAGLGLGDDAVSVQGAVTPGEAATEGAASQGTASGCGMRCWATVGAGAGVALVLLSGGAL